MPAVPAATSVIASVILTLDLKERVYTAISPNFQGLGRLAGNDAGIRSLSPGWSFIFSAQVARSLRWLVSCRSRANNGIARLAPAILRILPTLATRACKLYRQ